MLGCQTSVELTLKKKNATQRTIRVCEVECYKCGDTVIVFWPYWGIVLCEDCLEYVKDIQYVNGGIHLELIV